MFLGLQLSISSELEKGVTDGTRPPIVMRGRIWKEGRRRKRRKEEEEEEEEDEEEEEEDEKKKKKKKHLKERVSIFFE